MAETTDVEVQEFLDDMKKGAVSDRGLEAAFRKLAKGEDTASVTAELLRQGMASQDVTVDKEDVAEIVVEVKEDWKDGNRINCEEFKSIVKKLMGRTVVAQLTNICEALHAEKRVVMWGPQDVGKTWMAKKIADRAVRKVFDFAVWIYPEKIYHGGFTLQESIAHQLFLMLAFHKSEAEDQAKPREDLQQHNANPLDKSHQDDERKKRKLEKMIQEAVTDKELLLISDYQDSTNLHDPNLSISEDSDLKRILKGKNRSEANLVITRSWQEWPATNGHDVVIEVVEWTWAEARAAVEWTWTKAQPAGAVFGKKEKDLADFFIAKTRRLPAKVIIIAKTMSYIGNKFGVQKLESIREAMIMKEEKDGSKVIQMLITEYDLIPRSILIDCYSNFVTTNKHFLDRSQRGIVNFNELISYWIIEKHLGKFDSLQDEYEEGHRVVMELLDCGLLRKLENSYVMSSGWKFDFDMLEYYKFFGDVHLGMGETFDSKMGRMALVDGIMRTVAGRHEEEKPQKVEKMVTLMLDGNHLELPEHSLFDLPDNELFKKGFLEPQLEILAVFNPTVKPFPLPYKKLEKLRLLVLRGCRYLTIFQQDVFSKADPVLPLRNMVVLEISGPSYLDELPDSLFQDMLELRSVNLSSLEITSLPKSFYDSNKVEYLILRDCRKLKELKSLEKFTELQLLDVSGSSGLQSFKQKNFAHNKHLRVINFSRTWIDRIPLIRSLEKLVSLTLSDCRDLRGIRKVDGLPSLQILNISGSSRIEEFSDPTIKLDRIELIDVSGTAMRRLPGWMGNPRFLHIKNCLQLTDLLPIHSLKRLEVLDVSGSCNLNEIKDDFMENLECLRELNLSKTDITYLPSLPSPGNLRRLWLSDCKSLEKLGGLSKMEGLEELHLSGSKALDKMEDGSFDKMEQLHTLSLCRLELLDRLPLLSGLKKLKKLYVTDCPKVTSLPGVDELQVLRTLDHSGTTLSSRPSFCPGCNPIVTGPVAVSLDGFNAQQLLKDLGATHDLKTICQQHEQPHVDAQGNGSKMKEITEEDLKHCNWKISSWTRNVDAGQQKISSWTCKVDAGQQILSSPGMHFLQLLKMHPSLLKDEEFFSKFHFLLIPTDARIKLPDASLYSDELKLRDELYSKQLQMDKMQKCLEIRGFIEFPKFAQYLLEEAESVVLIDNHFHFLRFLLHLGPDGVKAMKACWLERCNEMKYLIQSEVTDGADKTANHWSVLVDSLQNLQILYLSHVMKLVQISNRDIPGFRFKKLKILYLEFCPQLSSICSSFSEFEALETLHIRNCQNLEKLSEDESPEVLNLTELHLWGLPNLEKIELKAPSLVKLRVGDCCLLEHVLCTIQGSHDNLKLLQIRSCEKVKRICEAPDKDLSTCAPKLCELELWELPELRGIATSVQTLERLTVGECHSLKKLMNVPGNLKSLEIKSCEKLESIFEPEVDVMENVEKKELVCLLEKMELVCLPEVKSIGADRFPSLEEEECLIWGCPKLKKRAIWKEKGEEHGRHLYLE